MVNNTAERWFTWTLTSTFNAAIRSRNTTDSRLFPAVLGRRILAQCNPGIIDKNIYLSIIADKSVRKCQYGLKSREVDECKLGIFETGGLYGLPVITLETETARWVLDRSLTLKGSLTLLLAATPEDQPLWVHRGEVLCSLEAQSNIGPYDNDGLACKVGMFHRGHLPQLILDELE